MLSKALLGNLVFYIPAPQPEPLSHPSGPTGSPQLAPRANSGATCTRKQTWSDPDHLPSAQGSQLEGLGRMATRHPSSSAIYLQKASLQQEHLVCIGGCPSEEAFHSPGLPKPATKKLTPGPGGSGCPPLVQAQFSRGWSCCSQVFDIYSTLSCPGP